MCTFRWLRQGQGIRASKRDCMMRDASLGLGFLSSLNCLQPAAAARHRRHVAKRSRCFTPQSGRYVGVCLLSRAPWHACLSVMMTAMAVKMASARSFECCRHVRKWTVLQGDARSLLKQAPTHATAFPRLPASDFLVEAVQPKHLAPACCCRSL